MSKTYYNYDPITKELLSGPIEANPFPGRTDWNDENEAKWALPANATWKVPVVEEGNTSIFDIDTQTWSTVEDHRGKTVYKKTDQSEKKITEFGPIGEEYTLEVPTTEFDEWNNGWQESIEQKKTFQVSQIKNKAGEIIRSYYPEYKQRNMTARGVEIMNAKVANTATQADLDEEAALQEAWDWIKAVRERSNVMEDGLVTSNQDINVEVGSIDGQGYWPIHPSEL